MKTNKEAYSSKGLVDPPEYGFVMIGNGLP